LTTGPTLQIRIYHEQNLLFSGDLDGPVELGRQRLDEAPPYAQIAGEGGTRLIIAPLQEQAVSRRQLLIEPLGDNEIRLTNLSRAMPVRIEGNNELPPGDRIELKLPCSLNIMRRFVRLLPEQQDEGVHTLSARTRLPSRTDSMDSLVSSRSSLIDSDQLRWEQVVDWLRSVMDVLQGAASNDDFFETAVRAAIGMVGLDSARVLTFRDGKWETEAVAGAGLTRSVDWRASSSVLRRVRSEKRTFWRSEGDLGLQSESLMGFTSVVAAPILDEHGEVIAVLYGDRRVTTVVDEIQGLNEIDAMLVELLACGIASGLARLEQERAALAAQTRFEEFFTPRLSKRLLGDRSLLEGVEREVTVFFCDIRGFSRVTERMGPQATVRWLNQILGEISDAILDREGVLVDYSGDEAMAMWGAPEEQRDQASRACDAALAILERLPELNRRWGAELQESIEVGIGINTGSAYVGNIGSHRKFKYGPLGNTVNLASRIQGASKYFQSQLLVSESTLRQLDRELVDRQSRRVCRVKVVNIEDPLDLYEIVPAGDAAFGVRKELLETAWNALDGGDVSGAMHSLDELLRQVPDDYAARSIRNLLTSREGDQSLRESGIWIVPGK
jgi:adenylate cyclase